MKNYELRGFSVLSFFFSFSFLQKHDKKSADKN